MRVNSNLHRQVMVAGSFLPRIFDEADENKQVAGSLPAAVEGVSVIARTRKSRRFFRRKNKKQVFTETFKYFAKWA